MKKRRHQKRKEKQRARAAKSKARQYRKTYNVLKRSTNTFQYDIRKAVRTNIENWMQYYIEPQVHQYELIQLRQMIQYFVLERVQFVYMEVETHVQNVLRQREDI